MSRGRYYTVKSDKLGPALGVVTGAEGRLDLQPLAEAALASNPPTYPMTIEASSVSLGHYLRQGGETVVLGGITINNYPLPTGGTFVFTVENASEAFLAHETTTAPAAGLLICSRLDKV